MVFFYSGREEDGRICRNGVRLKANGMGLCGVVIYCAVLA